jgi:hypothetical protein
MTRTQKPEDTMLSLTTLERGEEVTDNEEELKA